MTSPTPNQSCDAPLRWEFTEGIIMGTTAIDGGENEVAILKSRARRTLGIELETRTAS